MKLQVSLYRRGRMTYLRGMPLLLLTTTGRKSGKKRTVPLMYIKDGANYVVTGSNGGNNQHPAWWYNLQSNPTATIEVDATSHTVVAQQATTEERESLWAQFVQAASFYGDYQEKTDREIPVVILRLEDKE